MPLRRVPTELAGEAGNSIIARLRLFAHEESAYIATGIKELLGAKGIASRSKGRYSSGLPMHVFCVCVCHTLFPRVSITPLFQQGVKASSNEPCPTKLSRWRGSEWRRPFIRVPATETVAQAVPLSVCWHGGCS